DSFAASPNPVGTGQVVSFTVNARVSDGPALFPTISVVLPSGMSFTSCEPNCTPPGTANGGTVSNTFGSDGPSSLSLVVNAQVTAPSGSTLNATASIST